MSYDELCYVDVSMQEKANGAFRVFSDTYVTDESGTGVVHQAPAFGEVCYGSHTVIV